MLYLNNVFLPLLKQGKGFFLGGKILCALVILTNYAHGQNTGMVFGPNVVAEETVVDFRIGYDADEDSWVYRNHLQHSFSDSFNLRGIFLHKINSSNKWDFRLFRVEGLWQFLESREAGWDSALRFDLEIAEGDNLPSRIRLAWSGAYDMNNDWRITSNFLTGDEIGPASDSEELFEVRAQISRRLNKKSRLAIDYFGNMNNVKALGDWESHRHQLGPTLNIHPNKTITITAGALFGLSPAASDMEYRLAATYAF